jgi:septal ring-binding cell division protein DamX
LDDVVSAAESRVEAGTASSPAEQDEEQGTLDKVRRWFTFSDDDKDTQGSDVDTAKPAVARSFSDNDEGFGDIRPKVNTSDRASPESNQPAPNSDDSGFTPVSTIKRWFGAEDELPPPAKQAAPVVEGNAEVVAPLSTPIRPKAKSSRSQPKKAARTKPSAKPQSKPKKPVSSRPRSKPAKPEYSTSGKQKVHTIQLTASAQKSGFRDQLKQNQISAGKAWVFEEERNGQPWYSLFYGRYNSLEEALDAMEKLPKEMSVFSPWIRKFDISS